jgi:hypothetical protein
MATYTSATFTFQPLYWGNVIGSDYHNQVNVVFSVDTAGPSTTWLAGTFTIADDQVTVTGGTITGISRHEYAPGAPLWEAVTGLNLDYGAVSQFTK